MIVYWKYKYMCNTTLYPCLLTLSFNKKKKFSLGIKSEISSTDNNCVLCQVVFIRFITPASLDILTLESVGIKSLFQFF